MNYTGPRGRTRLRGPVVCPRGAAFPDTGGRPAGKLGLHCRGGIVQNPPARKNAPATAGRGAAV